MRSKKLISAAAALSMAVSSFAGIVTANAEDTEKVYNFSELAECATKNASVSVFDGAITLSAAENAAPLTVSQAAVSPLGNTLSFTSALKAKSLKTTISLGAGETVVVYYGGTDSAGTGVKSLSMVVTDSNGTQLASEANEEKNSQKPYVISYKAETAGTYSIVDTGASNRTLIYAVATTTGDYVPAADITAAPATADPDATPAPTPTPRATVDPNGVADITITNSAGWLETAYVTWTNPTPVDYYNVYVKPEGGEYTKLDDELIRYYGSYYRADAMGLKAGGYQLKVEPVIGGAAQEAKETGVLEVQAQIREGFAFDPKSSNYDPEGVGGYKNDGTLKDGAKVVYITDANKDAVQFDVVTNTSKGTVTSCTGLGEILSAREKNGAETTPLIIRMIGQVESPAGKNSSGYMQIKSTSNITFEGVGDDATTYHWSFLLRDTNNIEVRNLAVMEFYDDGISLDTDNFNDWIHNCDIFYGQNRGGDQKKGDGSLDVKTGSDYCTFSYNHFWDSGKSSLCGMKADSYQGYHMTYHHNWFDHSDSRHPRVRGDQVHVYNNYYDGNSKYGIGSCTGSSVYVEKNVFRNCLHPVLISMQGTDALGDGTFSGEDGGVIKMYDNAVYGGIGIIYASETNTNDFDAYLAQSRDEQVPSEYSAKQGGGTYSNFDTAADMYSYTPTDTADVVANVQTYAGRIEGGDFTYEFNDETDDALYDRDETLGNALQDYITSLETEYATGDAYPGTGGEMPTPRPTADPFDPDAQPTAKPSGGTGGSDTSEVTVIWRASDTGANVAAGTVLKEDWLTLVGAELAYKSTNKTIGGVALTGRMAGLSENPKPSLENPESGAALKFTPSADGTVKAYFKLNSEKTFYITDAAGNIINSYENTSDSSEYTTLSADVAAGTVYYAFGGGTNAEFWAAEYTSNGSYSDDADDDSTETPEPDATTAPGVTAEPDATKAPDATTAPSDDKCVKLTASYNEDGTLAGVTITEVPASEATAAVREGNVLTAYWDSLSGMKPVTVSDTPGEDATNPPAVSDEPINGVTPEKTIQVGSGIKLSADDLAQAEYKETIEINGFYVGADDSADDNGKSTGSVTVDSAGSSGATVNGTKYYNRIKTGGSGNPETGVRCFYFAVDADCSMVMDATSSSSSAARDVVVLHGDTAEHITVNDKAGYNVAEIKAGETVIIYSTEGGLNVYGIALTPGSESGGAVTDSWTSSADDIGIAAATFTAE